MLNVDDDSTDELRPIPGLPGYLASRRGSVFSMIKQGSATKQRDRAYRLRTKRNKSGHLRVYARNRYHLVHRLVLLAFVGPCPQGMECCHGDGNPENNNVENLRWGTRSENVADMIRHGTHVCNAKLSYAKAMGILDRINSGMSQREVAAQFGVSQPTVSAVVCGKRWSVRSAT